MRSESINHRVLRKIGESIRTTASLEDGGQHVVVTLTEAMGLKGTNLMLLDRKTGELYVVASHGLSQEYLEKGPISARKSIAESLEDGPVCIVDAQNDPRIQYGHEAEKEGIKSIMSAPIVIGNKPVGVLRLYSAEAWNFSEKDFVFAQAVSELIGMAVEYARLYKGLKSSIEVLKTLKPASKPASRTLYE